MPRVLVIDDDPVILEVVAEILKTKDYEVATAHNGESGINELRNNYYDLVLTDLAMPEVDGMEVLTHVVSSCPDTKCIILTGYGTIKSSVNAIKNGAFDYITKPISSSELLVVIEKALKFRDLEEENLRLKRELRLKYRYKNIIGTSDAIKKIYSLIEKVADTDSTVLISGSSGTGKELIARSVHYDSGRCDKPLVTINCGAIPEELLESELFGHEKGSFTGAHKRRIGRFEMANGGTIFLDEVGEMSPALQVKLLRVLQEQKFDRVGGTKTVHVDVRIIAATNKNLTVAINKGKFREDLYYRLNVIPIKVPSLKQRKSDIPLLLDFFMKRFQKGRKKRITGFTPDALEAMNNYDWPGNVRELENVIKRLSILCENEVAGFEDLPEHIQENSRLIHPVEEDIFEEGLTLDEAVKDYEKKLILDALEKSNWVKTKAAKLLNIKRTTLVEKIKKRNLTGAASA
jgi:DNA-binding NtrC family response regulator